MNIEQFLTEKGFSDLLEKPAITPNHSGSMRTLEWLFEKYAEESAKELQHFKDSSTGLWCTDRPDMIMDENKIMFQL